MTIAIISTLILSLSILLFFERRLTQIAEPVSKLIIFTGISKLVASSLFIIFYLTLSPDFNSFSLLILSALILSFVGDLLLVPKGNQGAFMAGILAFALAHLGYAGAFLLLPMTYLLLAINTILMMLAAALIYRWLRPGLNGKFKYLVPGYLAIISLMVILGASVAIKTENYWLLTGSLLFALSDIFVARNRFVTPAFSNRLIGLPLYYTAQLMLAYGAISVTGL